MGTCIIKKPEDSHLTVSLESPETTKKPNHQIVLNESAASDEASKEMTTPKLNQNGQAQRGDDQTTVMNHMTTIGALDEEEKEETDPFSQIARGEKIGDGPYGQVFECFHRVTGKVLAMKVLKFAKDQPDLLKKQLAVIHKEMDKLKNLTHDNLVKYYGARSNIADGTIEILMEKVPGGNLANLFKNYSKFDEQLLSRFLVQIVNALGYLHENNVKHRNLKAANILITVDAVVKISDYGFAKILRIPDSHAIKHVPMPNFPLQTVIWTAPEVLLEGNETTACDVWSLACTVIEILSKKPPWDGQYNKFIDFINMLGDKNMFPKFPPSISPICDEFLHAALNRDPTKRPTMEALQNNAFVQGLHPDQTDWEMESLLQSNAFMTKKSTFTIPLNGGFFKKDSNITHLQPGDMETSMFRRINSPADAVGGVGGIGQGPGMSGFGHHSQIGGVGGSLLNNGKNRNDHKDDKGGSPDDRLAAVKTSVVSRAEMQRMWEEELAREVERNCLRDEEQQMEGVVEVNSKDEHSRSRIDDGDNNSKSIKENKEKELKDNKDAEEALTRELKEHQA